MDSEENGNVAVMRKTLTAVRKALWELMGTSSESLRERRAIEISSKIRAALNAKPRNCDVGTAEEQAERFAKHCDNFARCTGCPCCGKVSYGRCEFAWTQMPYEEEDDEHNSEDRAGS